MKIHLLRAEHFSVPGIITKAFATSGAAEDAAMSLVNIMLKDNGQAQSANASNWRSKVEALQDEHGAAHCYVEIEEVDVEGATADPARDAAHDMLAALKGLLSWAEHMGGWEAAVWGEAMEVVRKAEGRANG